MGLLLSQTVPYQFDTEVSPYRAAEFEFALIDLERKGFQGVELSICYPALVNPEILMRLTAKRHLKITTIATGQIVGKECCTLLDADPQKRAFAQKVLMEHIRLSEKVGRPPVTVGLLRGGRAELSTDELEKQLRQSLLPCVELAEKKGVTLQIEPIQANEAPYLHTVSEGMHLIAMLGRPACLGILYDTYHAVHAESDMYEAILEAQGRITHVHIADLDRGLPNGQGIDFKKVFHVLQSEHYGGAFSLETCCKSSGMRFQQNEATGMKRVFGLKLDTEQLR